MGTNSARERFDTEVTIVDVLQAIHNQIYQRKPCKEINMVYAIHGANQGILQMN